MVAKNTTDTLTNKSMSGSQNTFTNLPASAFAAMTSAQLATIVSDETGSGALVFATSPTLVTPVLGVATATSLATTGSITINSGGNGATAVTRTLAGLELQAVGMNTSNKYTAPIKFMSSDPQLTTENPKLGAAIAGYALESYGADTDGGMGIEIFTTSIDPGTTNVPVSCARFQNGGMIIRTGVVFDDASTGQDSLNYYRSEIIDAAAAVTGGSGTGGTASISVVRIGDLISLNVGLTTGTGPSDATVVTSAGVLDAWARPDDNCWFSIPYNWTTNETAYMRVSTAGTISFYLRDHDDGTSNAWPASTYIGLFSVTYQA